MSWFMSASDKPLSLKAATLSAIHLGTIVWFGLRTAASWGLACHDTFCASSLCLKLARVLPGMTETDERGTEAVFEPRRDGQGATLDSMT